MKTTQHIFTIFLLILLATPLAAQHKLRVEKTEFAVAKTEMGTLLKGYWVRSRMAEKDGAIIFKKPKDITEQWGEYLDFRAGDALEKGYSAPCGNDSNIYSVNGSWTFDGDVLELDVRDMKGMYAVKFENADKLILTRL